MEGTGAHKKPEISGFALSARFFHPSFCPSGPIRSFPATSLPPGLPAALTVRQKISVSGWKNGTASAKMPYPSRKKK